MEAVLRVNFQKCFSVKCDCRISDFNQDANMRFRQVVLHNNQLNSLIGEGMICRLSLPGDEHRDGIIKTIEKNDGNIYLRIMENKQGVLS
jgi:hypothetical protein